MTMYHVTVALCLTIYAVCGTAHSVREHEAATAAAAVPIAESINSFVSPSVTSSSPLTTDLQNWLNNDDVASALRLEPLELLRVPIHLYVLTAGLEHLNISFERLDEWFAQLALDLPHTHVKTHGDVTPTPQSPSAAPPIVYTYHFHHAQLSPLVTDAIRQTLQSHYRLTNAHHSTAPVQIHTHTLTALLDSLLQHMQLTNVYTLFILHPTTSWLQSTTSATNSTLKYGYRVGPSNNEIDEMIDSKDEELQRSIHEAATKNKDNWNSHDDINQRNPYSFPSEEERKNRSATNTSRIIRHNWIDTSAEWAQSLLNNVHIRGPLHLHSYIDQLMNTHPQVLRSVINNPYAQEECLTDTFVGTHRSLVIDLNAGPFTWGPLVGGDGVRVETSLPNVKAFYRHTVDDADDDNSDSDPWDLVVHEHKDKIDLESVITELSILTSRYQAMGCQLKDNAPQTQSEDIQVQEQVEEQDNDAHPFQAECHQIKLSIISLTKVKDQLNNNNNDSQQYNTDDDSSSSNLLTILTQDFDLNNKHTHNNKNNNNNNTEEVVEEEEDADLTIDGFLSHLTAVMHTALTHIITPSTADILHRQNIHYTQVITFHLYILNNQNTYFALENNLIDHLKYSLNQIRLLSQRFEYIIHTLSMKDDIRLSMAYTGSLRTSVIPNIMFDGHFAAIKRIYLSSQAVNEAIKYLHTSHNNNNNFETLHNKLLMSRDIRIFLFSVDYPLPLLIDQHYQSVPLPDRDSVIAVQSKFHLWESPIQCNGLPIYWNLRNPIRSIVNSVLHVLVGTVPYHIGYEPAHETTVANWLWSNGYSSLSYTSNQATDIPIVTRDAIHRYYVLNALQQIVAELNAAIARLSLITPTVRNAAMSGINSAGVKMIPTLNADSYFDVDGRIKAHSPLSWSDVRVHDESELLTMSYNGILADIDVILLLTEHLQFDVAALQLSLLADDVDHFVSVINDVHEWAEHRQCISLATDASFAASARSVLQVPSSYMTLHPAIYIVTVLICIALFIHRALLRSKIKPKIN